MGEWGAEGVAMEGRRGGGRGRRGMWQRRESSVSGKSGEHCVAGGAGEFGGGGGVRSGD